MACGHCRRPRKKDRGIELGSSFLHLKIVELSLESQVALEMMLGRLKMGPELASWYTQISPGRSIATLAAATAPPAPSGSTDMREGCIGSQVRRGSPGDATNRFWTPAPSAQSSKTTLLLACPLIFLPYNSNPHARPPGSADSRGLTPTGADPEKKQLS